MRASTWRLAVAGAAAVAAVVLAAPAGAHVEPQEAEAPAASHFTFGFVIEHGCGDSPTVEVAIQTPPGSFDVRPVDKPGWTATVQESDPPVVTFTGGPLAADVPDAFSIELVTPDAPGTEVLFPTVQVCEVGELAWIEVEEGGDHPAPRVRLTENPDPVRPTTTTATSTTTTATTAPDPTTTAPEPTDVDGVAAAAAGNDGDDGGGGGGAVVPVVIGAAVVAALAAGAVALTRRRRAAA